MSYQICSAGTLDGGTPVNTGSLLYHKKLISSTKVLTCLMQTYISSVGCNSLRILIGSLLFQLWSFTFLP